MGRDPKGRSSYLDTRCAGSEPQADPVKKSWRGTKRLLLKLGMAPLSHVRLEEAAFESDPLSQSFFSHAQ